MSGNEPIGIGIIGCGTVGQGVVRLLEELGETYAARLGRPIELRRILVRDASTPRNVDLPEGVLTDDAEAFFGDAGIRIVLELAGGIDPVGALVRRALESGRHVVTANKALLAAEGRALFELARQNDVAIAFEASCGGGIPILGALKFGLAANRIDAIYGVLNGTCNYILTQMTDAGAAYDDALADAQARGFAEADPTMDVGGADAAQKLAIIASLAFGVAVDESDVTTSGIDGLELEDIFYAAELGYQVRLLAVADRRADGLALSVAPTLVPADEPLAQVRNAFNAVSVFGHAVGHSMYYGHGAGQMPTASAVVGDLLAVADGWYGHAFGASRLWPDQQSAAAIAPADGVPYRHYLRIHAEDRPNVMAQLAKIIGDNGISISSVMQQETEDGVLVPVIITTHEAPLGAMHTARDQIAALPVVGGPPVCLRIVELPAG